MNNSNKFAQQLIYFELRSVLKVFRYLSKSDFLEKQIKFCTSFQRILVMSSELRSKVINLYKHLQYLGREYPGPNGPQKFRQQIRDAFMKHKDETDPQKIKALLAHGRYVAKEVEALYQLKKYRHLKQRYCD